jgi:MOSC domain-containing protein YiiM
VVEEGEVAAGDEIMLVQKQENSLTIRELNYLYAATDPDPALLQRSLTVSVLPESWRERFAARLEAIRQKTAAV